MAAKRKSGAKPKPRAKPAAKTPKPKPKLKAKPKAKPKAKRASNGAVRRPKRAATEPSLPLSEIEARAAASGSLAPAARLAELKELEEASFELEGREMDRAHAAIHLAELALIKQAQDEPEARGAFLSAVREAPWKGHWIAALGTFGDDESFQFVREMARKQLDLEYYDTQPAWFFTLGALAHRAQFSEDARGFVLGAFDYLAAKSRNAPERKLVNSVAFGALAYVAAALPHPQTGPALHRAFRIAADDDAHYELNVTSGPLAIALANVGYAEAMPDIQAFLDNFEWRYQGAAFVLQARYALWLLGNDGAGALDYLRDPTHDKSLGLVAAALADLDHKPGRDALAERARTLTNPVAQEAFTEAIARLDSQRGPPFRDGRMIWMFGRRSPTEQALGEESDNVFVKRAMARTQNPELGVVYEADDSPVVD